MAVVDVGRVKDIDLALGTLGVNGERGVKGIMSRDGAGSGGGRVQRQDGGGGPAERLAKGSSSMRKAGGGELRGEVTKGRAGDVSFEGVVRSRDIPLTGELGQVLET